MRSHHPAGSPRFSKFAGRSFAPAVVVWLLAAVACAVVAGGCSRRVMIDPTQSDGGENSTGSKDQCGELFANALVMAQPDRLGITTERPQVRDMFNQWRTDCLKRSAAPPLGPEARKHFERRPAGVASGATDMQFTERDVELLRTRLLMKRAADSVVRTADHDIDRVNLLFQYVVRNVALVSSASEPLPVGSFEILLFGRGTAEDRAWVFAELLKQLRIDAVVLRPKAGAPGNPTGNSVGTPPRSDAGVKAGGAAESDGVAVAETPSAAETPDRASPDDAPSGDAPRDVGKSIPSAVEPMFLVGVLLDEPGKPVYLFDTALGMAIPAPGDESFAPRPATLDQAVADASVLKRLDLDERAPYRFTQGMLKSVAVEAICGGDGSLPRLAVLQNHLTGDDSVVLSDPLDDTDDAPGLLARVRSFGRGRWSDADVSPASLVDEALDAAERPTESQKRRRLVRLRPFDAPMTMTPNPEKKTIDFGAPKKNQLKTRIAQLMGDRKVAVGSYNLLRVDGAINPRANPPPDIVKMHARAEEDAFFWTGVCQYELGDFDAAAATFGDYLRRFPQGEWVDHGRGLQALAWIARDKFAAASQALGAVSEADPARTGHLLLLKHVRARREAAGK